MSEFELQSCDGRQLIQKITEILVKELVEVRSKVCVEFENSMRDFGVTVVAPCNIINTPLLRLIISTPSENILPILLDRLNLPPHILQLLTKGFDKLSEEQQKDILKFLQNSGAEFPPYTFEILNFQGNIRQGYEALTPAQQEDIRQWFQSRGLRFASNYLLQLAQSYVTPKVKCPSPEVLQQLIQVVTLLKRIINSLINTLETLQQITSALSATINALSLSLDALRATVKANEVSLVASAATPTGTAALFARILQKLDKLADNIRTGIQGPSRLYGEKGLDGLTCQAAKVVDYVTVQVQVLQLFVNILDSFLQSCSIVQINTGNLSPVQISRGGEVGNETYRGYSIEIQVDINSPAIAPLRYAVAIDRIGVVVFQGQKSFSSSTEILIQEVKFAIDQLSN